MHARSNIAPPKALDEEEVAYLDSVRQREESRDRRRAEEEERELAAFGACVRVCALLRCPVSGCLALDFPILSEQAPPTPQKNTHHSHRPRQPRP